MNLRRVGVLLFKELVQGPKNFLFIFALVVPLVMTFLVSLLFGSFFSGKPKLGITDQGNSYFTTEALKTDAFIVEEFETEDELKRSTEIGAVDIGITVPADFDTKVAAGETTEMNVYVWGESLLKNRIMLVSGMAVWVRDIAGLESPVEIAATTLGNIESLPWEERLMPLIVMMSVLIGGVMVPATSMVDEKQKGTLTALATTPTTMGDIYTAKALLGVILSTFTGVMILLLNRSFGVNPPLLVFLLILGAIMAAELGVMLGALLKDINTLFATIKGLGLLLYAPAIIYMFPAIPQWIGKLFPTYYMIQPVIEVTQHGASWREVAGMVYILLGLIVLLGFVLALITRRKREREH
jgi:ABC-2 type transport system permease protein